jgi:hypothetical protein
MRSVNTFRILAFSAGTLALVAVSPSPAEAQRRGVIVRRPVVRTVVVHRPVVFGGYYRHGYPFYGRNFWWTSYGYPWGPYPGGYYGYGWRVDATSTVRVQVTPREAEVFVDGYSAGLVDDFDGVFQRLRVPPGGHEIAIYLEGYRTLRRNVYLHPGGSHTIRHTLEPLAAGEPMDPPPAPSDAPSRDDAYNPASAAPPPYEPQADSSPAAEPAAAPRARFGTLVLRVQPSDADLLLDGERWSAAAGESRVSIRLTEGRHVVEIRKAGFSVYREEVLIRNNATLTLNVALTGQ